MKSMYKNFRITILGLLSLTTFLSAFGTGISSGEGGYEIIPVEAQTTENQTDTESEDYALDESQNFVEGKVLIKYKFQGIRLFGRQPSFPKHSGIVSLEKMNIGQKTQKDISKPLTFNETVYYEATLADNLPVEAAVNQLNQLSNVEYAEPIYVRKVDSTLPSVVRASDSSLVGEQYYHDMINLAPARQFLEEQGINPGGARDVIVAVIDTGVDYNHEDLASNMWVNPGEVADNGIDDDNNGWIDDVHGINPIVGKYNVEGGDPMDDHGHGTHVAGIIAADGTNGIGITGIASNVRIMAIKAGQQTGVLLSSDIVEAIDYARLMGADVINMSFGGYSASQIEREALELAFNGSVLVAAAGNDAKTTKPHPQGANMYPAAYPWVLGVMATDSNNTLASFSNYDYMPRDAQEYEVAVPGSQIISTLPNGRYAKWSGTSMATPMVSGQAALLKSYFNDPMSHSSRFIMGQIIGTGPTNVAIPTKLKENGMTLYDTFSGIDISNSLRSAPKPELSLYDTFIWDPETLNADYNNANGVLDNGETVQLGIEIRNHWGKANNVNVMIDTKNSIGIDNPYVTILSDNINYGAVGTFNHDDNGWIYDENKEITGLDEPFVIQVAPDAPNDYFVTFNVTMTAYNGLDPADTGMYTFMGSFTYTIRNGTVLPNVISEDMTLTSDRYWIIPNSTIIMEQATVTVEPGTQIQFWSNDPDDPYAINAITYLRVDGKFIAQGTAEAPIKIFPSDIMGAFEVKIFKSGSNPYIELNYTEICNPNIEADRIDFCKFTQNYDYVSRRYLDSSTGRVYSHPYATTSINARYVSNSIFKGLGNSLYGSSASISGNLYNNLFDSNFIGFGFSGSYTITGNTFLNNYVLDQYGRIMTSSMNVYFNGEATTNFKPAASSLNYNSVTGATYFVLEAFSWQKDEVSKFAESVGGYLASIESQDEQNYLYQRYGSQEVVIGLEIAQTNEVRWASGEGLYYVTPTTSIIDSGTRTLLVNEPTIYQSFVMKGNKWEITNDQNVKRSYLIEIPGEIYVTDINFETNTITLGDSGKPFAVDVLLTPYTADPSTLIWTSSDETVVGISEDHKIIPLKAGTATITVSSSDGVIVKTITVNVITVVPLESMQLSIPSTQLNVGDVIKGTVTFMPTNTTEKAVLWTSSDASIVSVDAYGNITAKKTGTVTITVQNYEGTLSSSVTLTVVQPVGSVNIAETNILVPLTSETTTIDVTVGPSTATNQILIWESSNPEVAYVNEGGVLVTIGYGTAILRATAQYTNIYDEIIVSVIELSEASLRFETVQTGQYNNQYYMFGLTDEGALWVWGGEFFLPTKSSLIGIDLLSIDYEFAILYTLAGEIKTPNVSSLIASARSNSTLKIDDIPSLGNLGPIRYVKNFYCSYFVVDEQGNGWAWGSNEQGRLGVGVTGGAGVTSPLQILGLTNIKEISGHTWSSYCFFLTDEGGIFKSVNSVDGTIMTVSSGAIKFVDNFGVYFANDHTLRYSENGSVFMYLSTNICAVSMNANPYYYLTVEGKLTSSSLLGTEYPGRLFSDVYYLPGSQNWVALTQDGKVFMWGKNNFRQLANLSTTDYYFPLEIQFGIKMFDTDVQVEIQNVNQGDVGVAVTTEIILDFNTAVKPSSQFAYIQIKDSAGTIVAMTREFRLDKLILSPNSNLKFNEKYTVVIPSDALQDIFGNQFAGTSFQFVTAETLGGSSETIPVTSITINSATTVVDAGSSIKLSADLLPLDTTQKSIRWTSGDRTIATVDMYGNVYGKKAGTVTITASNSDWSVIGTIEITVNQPVQSVAFGDTMLLKNVGSEPSPIPVTVLPLDATNPALTWETSNPEIAYVNAEGNLVVLSKGTTIIRATANDGGKYDDIIVSVSEEALEQVNTKKITQIEDNGLYTLALMQDGSVWVWGQNILVPTKTSYVGIKDISPIVYSGQMLVLLNDGKLYSIERSAIPYSIISPTNEAYKPSTIFSSKNEISGFSDVISVTQTYYSSSYFILRSNGEVWGWGENNQYQLGDGTNFYRSNPQKINGLANIIKISSSFYSTLFLSSNGELFFTGNGVNYPVATRLDTGVSNIQDSFNEWRYIKNNQIHFKTPEMVESSIQLNLNVGDTGLYIYDPGQYHVLSSQGKWQINGISPLPEIRFIKIGIASYHNVYAIAESGDLYMYGNNTYGQLANFTKTPSAEPTKINFGIVVNEAGLQLDSQNVSDLDTNVSINVEFSFDFNTAIKGGNNLPTIVLKDSLGNYLSVTATIKLDKLVVTVNDLLVYGETYTLILPGEVVVDYFNNSYCGQTIRFAVESAPSSTLGYSDNGRYYWNLSDVSAAIDTYNSQEGMLDYASPFALNAILNDIQDPRSDNWMKVVAQDSSSLRTISLNYNYWGTDSQTMVGNQILDFDDFQNLMNIDTSIILKSADVEKLESIYPFVLDFYFINENGDRTNIISLTGGDMHIVYNQDMDTTILPNVYFGPDVPYTDYKIEGQWIDSRHWVGTVRVTLLTGDGYQYMRIRDAVSASNPWLVSGDDEKRLQFEIITSGTESMTLQATSAEGRVILSWMQDEYAPELMAGYNIYRADSVDGNYARINDSVITETQYEDLNAAPGIVYYYKFTVVQTDFTESDFSNIAAAAAFDTILPSLSHNVFTSLKTGQDYSVIAYASDNIGVEKVTFSYRLEGETSFTTVDMTRDGTTNKYTYLLKSSYVTTASFDYFISAYDGLSSVSSGTQVSPHHVTIQDVPTITAVSPNSGSTMGGTTVTITGANFKEGVKVYFAELEGLNVTLLDSNRVTVVSPRYYASQVNIRVVNPFGGEAVKTNGFTYLSDEATIGLPTVKANQGQEILIPVRVTNVEGLLALDYVVTYDATVLTYVESIKGTMGTRFVTLVNKTTAGQLRISMAADLSVTGSGDILYLKFKVTTGTFTSTPVNITSALLNSGNIPTVISNGLVVYEPVLSFTTTVYYFGNSAAVENVTIILSNSDVENIGVTNANGVLTFTSVSKGDYTLSFDKEDDTEAITAYDASLILQHAVGLISLNDQKQIVADVNNDGRINALDASYILQYVAGFTVLPFSGRDASWLFITNQTTFTGLTNNTNVQVTAYLIGDVSGNYGTTSTQVSSLDGAYRVGPISTDQGLLYVPVDLILNSDGVYALSFKLTFDPTLRVKSITYHASLENAFKVANTNVAGQVTFAIAGVDALSSMKGLITVEFEQTQVQDSYSFGIVSSMINESTNLVNVMNSYTTITDTDFNHDGVVDERDLITLVNSLNQTYSDANISPFDFNSDGIVDLYDIILMIQSQRANAA